MTTAFISDLHLTPNRPESTQWFRQFMHTSQNKVNEIYILGDLFDFWIGDDAADFLGHSEAEEILRTTKQSGIATYFIHGNRDFLVGSEFEQRTGCQILADPTVITLGGERVLLTHGDTLCTDDVEHQEFRALTTTDKWKIAFLNKPIEQRMNEVLSLRERSEAGKKVKSMEIMDVNQGAVEAIMTENKVLTMIHGHTHRPKIHTFNLGKNTATRYVLGDWFTQKSMLIVDNGRYSLLK